MTNIAIGINGSTFDEKDDMFFSRQGKSYFYLATTAVGVRRRETGCCVFE
jgi:hypothetical protein